MNDEDKPLGNPPVKAGYKTSEFWLSAATSLISILYASGIIGEGTELDKTFGIIAAVLSTMGYTISRSIVKK